MTVRASSGGTQIVVSLTANGAIPVQYQNSIFTLAVGAGVPSGWTQEGSSVDIEVVADSAATKYGDRYIDTVSGAGSISPLTLDAAGSAADNCECLGLFTVTGTVGAAGDTVYDVFALRHQGGGSGDYYGFGPTVDAVGSKTLVGIKRSSAGDAPLASAAFTWAMDTLYWMRCRCQGTTLKAKIWAHGSAEPAAWTVTTTNGVLASGKIGIIVHRDQGNPTIGNKTYAFSAAVNLADIITVSNNNANARAMGNNSSLRVGQTFLMSGLGLTSIRFRMSKINSPGDSVVCDIYATSSDLPTGSSLGQSSAVAASSITAEANYDFAFANLALKNATKYAAVLSRTGAQDASNHYTVFLSDFDDYSNGQGVEDTGSWAAYGSGRDLNSELTVQASPWPPVPATTSLAVTLDNATNATIAANVPQGTAVLSGESTLIATARQIMAAFATLSNDVNLIASASQIFRTNPAVLPIQTDVITNATRYSAGSARLSIDANFFSNATVLKLISGVFAIDVNVLANAIRYSTGSAVLPINLNVAANANQRMVSSALLSITANLLASASRYTPTSAVLPISSGDLLANALRFSAGTAVLPISMSLTVDSTVVQGVKLATALLSIDMSFFANANQSMVTTATLPIDLNLLASALRYTPGQAQLDVVLNLLANPNQRMVASATLPINVNVLADAFIRGKIPAEAVLPIILNLLANATVRTTGSATLPIDVNLAANANQRMRTAATLPADSTLTANAGQQLMAGRATLPLTAFLQAAASRYTPGQATLPIAANVAASAARYSPAEAVLGASSALTALTKQNLAAAAAMAASGSLMASASALFGGQAIATAETDLIADTVANLAAFAECPSEMAFVCDATVRNFGRPQWITNVSGVVDATDSIAGVVRKVSRL